MTWCMIALPVIQMIICALTTLHSALCICICQNQLNSVVSNESALLRIFGLKINSQMIIYLLCDL